jgi:hypothetical protein
MLTPDEALVPTHPRIVHHLKSGQLWEDRTWIPHL